MLVKHEVFLYLITLGRIVSCVRGEASICCYIFACDVLELLLADDNFSTARRSRLDILL